MNNVCVFKLERASYYCVNCFFSLEKRETELYFRDISHIDWQSSFQGMKAHRFYFTSPCDCKNYERSDGNNQCFSRETTNQFRALRYRIQVRAVESIFPQPAAHRNHQPETAHSMFP